jgi:hypothetical protein
MYYAYVDPATGSDTPTSARRNPNAATAEASPWATLAAAEQYERTNLTTLGDSLTIRCKAGTESTAGGLNITSANWPGMSLTRYLTIEGVTSHGGGEASGTGYTFRDTSGNPAILLDADILLVLTNIRVISDEGNAVEVSGYTRLELNRCVMVGAGSGPEFLGGSADERKIICKNSLFIATAAGGQAVVCPTYNAGVITFEHCGFIGNHATLPAVSAADAQIFRWCYATNRLAGGAYGGAGWAGSTRSKNASSDTTGDATYQSIAFATGSGGYFSNITAGSVNLAIGASSALKEAATDSTETVDIIGTSRPQGTHRDIGVYELAAAGASAGRFAQYANQVISL